jgi:biopolymer transport protein ExbD
MITRPLDLASRMRSAPRSFDAFFYVNIGLILLFFGLFGSRFVLSPGLATDFRLPTAPDNNLVAGAMTADIVIAVPRDDMVLVEGEARNFDQLRKWLRDRVGERTDARLLVQAGVPVSAHELARIYAIAAEAGFASVLLAAEPSEETGSPAGAAAAGSGSGSGSGSGAKP